MLHQHLLYDIRCRWTWQELRDAAAKVTGQHKKAGSLPRQAMLRATDAATAAQVVRTQPWCKQVQILVDSEFDEKWCMKLRSCRVPKSPRRIARQQHLCPECIAQTDVL